MYIDKFYEVIFPINRNSLVFATDLEKKIANTKIWVTIAQILYWRKKASDNNPPSVYKPSPLPPVYKPSPNVSPLKVLSKMLVQGLFSEFYGI